MAASLMYEVWAYYIVGACIILTRFAVRFRTVGFTRFQGDDYMSILTLMFYTVDATSVTIVYRNGDNSFLTEQNLPTLTQAEIKKLELGSKFELTAWFSYTALIWCMKFTMLFFYQRLTLGSLHNRLVKYLFWFCGVCYVAVFLTIAAGCHPIHLNWQVIPLAPWKCRFRPQNFIVIALLNIITDAALLLIPIPMLWKLKIPLRRKLVIGAILSSGLFVITAAIIRVVYSLAGQPDSNNINRWGVRETFIGLITVNIPLLRPLITRSFWTWGSYNASTPQSNGSRSWKGRRLQESSVARGDVELGTTINSTPQGLASRSSSQENLRWDHKDNVVFVQTSYDISSTDRDEDESVTAPNNWTTSIRNPHT